jgi:acetyl-CoA carboxylase biotin carboxyl carrier protein
VKLTHDDVVSILELLERSNVEYLEVEVDGTRIVADRTGTTTRARGGIPATAGPAPHAAPAVAPRPPAPEPAPSTVSASRAAPSAPPASALATSTAAPPAVDLVTVTAPVLGVFFRAPQPGAPAFAEVGSHVPAGATLGLVEVMKMFNAVAAPTAGEVVEVLTADAQFVEYGQPLFQLRPAGA